MDPLPLDPALTRADRLVLQNLLRDNGELEGTDTPQEKGKEGGKSGGRHDSPVGTEDDATPGSADDFTDESVIRTMEAWNNPSDPSFDPTVFVLWDTPDLHARLPAWITQHVLQPYIRWARGVARVPTDVVMVTHLLLYFSTSVVSAGVLFYRFRWWHGVLHWLMQSYYVGTYNLMMHQHIHMRGVLARPYAWFDHAFPYLLDPLFGHTWNTYYYHHVKHHHVEGNGPDDLSSTIRYRRDHWPDLLRYIARFFFLVWFDLPRYFWRKGQRGQAVRAGASELSTLALYAVLFRWRPHATCMALLLEFVLLRIGLMVGNWGQHAFVDDVDPDSDFRSSITLVDVASNRFCYNDGYHTSHHLHPRRHWREHPVAFVRQKRTYAAEHALVFRDLDYIMLTVRLMMKDYAYLARRMVPLGEEQRRMALEERMAWLRRKTRAFGEEEVERLWGGKKA